MICYIDMDGVLVDCHSGMLKVHGIEDPYLNEENKGIWSLHKTSPELKGITKHEFFKHCEKDFWVNLEPTKEFNGIINLCHQKFGRENCAILTSPTYNDGCPVGKFEWVEKHLGEDYRRRTILCNNKEMLAHPEAFLIDDKDSNIGSFIKRGGQAFLFPRPWNKHHAIENIAIPLLHNHLLDILKQ